MIRAFRPLQIEGEAAVLGAVTFEIAAVLTGRGLVQDRDGQLWLGRADLDRQLEAIRDLLCGEGHIGKPRDESMPVRLAPGAPALGWIDRSAVRALGLWVDKVHINGIVQTGSCMQVWLARRASDADWNPDRFDTMVAGGRSNGRDVLETAHAEGWEEAGLQPPELADLRDAGRLALSYVTEKGLHREMLSIFDLVLPDDFVPQCQDGEIAFFRRVGLGRLALLVHDEAEMKFTSAMVCRALLGRMAAVAAPPGGPEQSV